jgi:hypothetical protein
LTGNCVAQALHEPLVEPQIVLRHQHRAKDFSRFHEMMHIGALEARAGRARASGFDRVSIFGKARIAQVDWPVRGKRLARPARPGRKHAIEHVDAAHHRPNDIVEAVVRGIDMFDCVLPTRSGRTGQAFTADGPLNLRNARFAEDQEPMEPGCPCPACTRFSRAYVHHLVKSGEILGAMLMTQHNLWFYQRLMQDLRDAIEQHRLTTFASEFLDRYRR